MNMETIEKTREVTGETEVPRCVYCHLPLTSDEFDFETRGDPGWHQGSRRLRQLSPEHDVLRDLRRSHALSATGLGRQRRVVAGLLGTRASERRLGPDHGRRHHPHGRDPGSDREGGLMDDIPIFTEEAKAVIRAAGGNVSGADWQPVMIRLADRLVRTLDQLKESEARLANHEEMAERLRLRTAECDDLRAQITRRTP